MKAIAAAEMQTRLRRSCYPTCRGGTFGAALYDPEGVGVVDFAALAAAHHTPDKADAARLHRAGRV